MPVYDKIARGALNTLMDILKVAPRDKYTNLAKLKNILGSDIYNAGGLKLHGIPDFALGPRGGSDIEHMYPQGLIWDQDILKPKMKGGLI